MLVTSHERGLVKTAERLTENGQLSAFSKLLEYIATAVHADGCILWEVASFMPEDKRYFVLVDHFFEGEEHGAGHYLTERSKTHLAITENHTVPVPDVDADPSLDESEFLKSKKIKSFFSVPIQLRKEHGEAALNLYYRTTNGFGPEEIATAESLAASVPHLFNSMVNSAVFGLLRKVDRVLRESGPPNNLAGHSPSLTKTLDRIAVLIKSLFQVAEVSIYLENPLDSPGRFQRKAGIWPWVEPVKPVPEYVRGDKGLTLYAIENGPVRFLDMFSFKEELALRQSRNGEYLGLEWNMNEISAKKAVARMLGDRWIPPCSFLCVPVKDETKTMGVIRCVMALRGPHYFDDTHVEGLSLVAERLGEWWGHAIEVERKRRDASQLGQFLKGIAQLNGYVYGELKKTQPDQKRIFDETLRILASHNASGEALAIRLLDSSEENLVAKATGGLRWKDKAAKEKQEQTFPVNGPFWTAQAVREQKVLSERAAQTSGRRANVFPDAHSWIVAPIICGGKAVGTIGTQRFSTQEFPEYAELVYELMGKQLGLYISLVEQLSSLREANRKLNEQSRQQIQVFEDFQHQIRNPIIKAHKLAQQFSRSPRSHSDLLLPLVSACRRADHISQSIRYFTALAQGMSPEVEKEVLRRRELMSRIEELVNDGMHGLDSRLRLSCETDEESFLVLDRITVMADKDLLLHCLDNLLDNALKYSFPETSILIRAGYVAQDHLFHIAMLNEGLRISVDEAKKLTARGYRGDQAQWSTAEGRGIGLWIVDNFMKAMKGSLKIVRTDSRGLNEFRLVLPAAPR